MPGQFTDLLAWIVVATFTASALIDVLGTHTDAERALTRSARGVAAVAWVVFAAFWLALFPHYAFELKSFVEGGLSVLAVPACLYVAYLVWAERPRLLRFSQAIAVMGLLYMPFQTVPLLEQVAIETTTRHAELLMESLGYSPEVTAGDDGYRSMFSFVIPTGPYEGRYLMPVLLACSGIGSISLVTGLVTATDAPLGRKVAALSVVVPIIYALNIVRVAFIVLAHGKQWFRPVADPVVVAFDTEPALASYYLSDRVISQVLSVIVLVAITWRLLRAFPSLTVFVEEVAYVLTGRELDLSTTFATGE